MENVDRETPRLAHWVIVGLYKQSKADETTTYVNLFISEADDED